MLDVVRSSYYKWREGREARAERERADQALAERIRAVHDESDRAYGAPRVTAELRDEHGMRINEKKVARVMRKFHIVGIHLRRSEIGQDASARASPSWPISLTRAVAPGGPPASNAGPFKNSPSPRRPSTGPWRRHGHRSNSASHA